MLPACVLRNTAPTTTHSSCLFLSISLSLSPRDLVRNMATLEPLHTRTASDDNNLTSATTTTTQSSDPLLPFTLFPIFLLCYCASFFPFLSSFRLSFLLDSASHLSLISYTNNMTRCTKFTHDLNLACESRILQEKHHKECSLSVQIRQ